MMIITQGLFARMVLQRGARNAAVAAVSGTCTGAGVVVTTVRRERSVWRGVRERAVGRARGGHFACRLPPLPTGGPYAIDLAIHAGDNRIVEQVRVADVWVGDVWLAAGQSNMEGIGERFHPPAPVRQVRACTLDDRWQVAADPLHDLSIAVDPVHTLLRGERPAPPLPHKGTGPAVTFAQTLHAATGVPQGIIACAHGGTGMTDWNPDRAAAEGNRCLFGALVRRLRRSGGRVAGLIWYQGCNDANPADAPHYTARMRRFVAAVRRTARAPRLPVVMVQLARVTTTTDPAQRRAWNDIQDQQRNLTRGIRHLAVVPAVDLPLDDCIHIAEAGQYRLGRRLAAAMRTLRGERPSTPPPIALRALRMRRDPFGRAAIDVRFDNVVGQLVSGGCRPMGFHLDGAPAGAHFDTVLDGARAIVRTGIPWSQAALWALSYGHDTDPACTVTDEADRSLPVFGPLRVGRVRALQPPVDRAWVSGLLAPPADWAALQPPADPAAVGLHWRVFTGWLNMRPEIARHPGEERLIWFVVPFRCAEPMRVAIALGYDGPLRSWLDGQPFADDPRGTNPCTLGKRRRVVTLTAGPHQLALALATHGGAAWGTMVQFERRDLPRRRILQGDYAMPEMLET